MRKQFRTYVDARKWIHAQNIKSVSEWKKFKTTKNFPQDIPKYPNESYKKEWIDWGDWFGSGSISPSKRQFLKYSQAKILVKTWNLKSQTQWRKWRNLKKIPQNIPSNPEVSYKNKGWKGWGDFLGTRNLSTSQINKKFLSFIDAKKHVHLQKIQNKDEWTNYCKSNNKPANIPSSPSGTYKKEWKGWGDFLGTEFVAYQNRQYVGYGDAKKIVIKLKFKNIVEWNAYTKSGLLPSNIPKAAELFYKKQGTWKGWGDFLGTGNKSPTERSKNYLSAKEAKPVLKKLFKKYGIKNEMDWKRFAKTHSKLLDELHLPSGLLNSYSLENAKKRLRN